MTAALDTSRGRDGLVDLTRALCDIPSVSGDEERIADAVEQTLRRAVAAGADARGGDAPPRAEVVRHGNNVVARTLHGRAQRVVLAGHLDTVPIADNLPTELRWAGDEHGGEQVLWGRGTVDMLGGVAVALQLAAELLPATTAPARDVSFVFYDNEEVSADRNGLGHLVRDHPELLTADLAVLGEPSNAGIEGGCNGTLRVHVVVPGVAAHSARAWTGVNAIHRAAPVLQRLADYEPATVTVDGLDYREGMNAVRIEGGIAGNVIPDRCVVTVNYRFAPSRSLEEAVQTARDLFEGFEVTVDDAAPGARPGLDAPLAAEFAGAVLGVTGGRPAPKEGWTDVARFAELGVPAVNFGPGDPLLAHKDDEQVPVAQLGICYDALRAWLTPQGALP